MNLNSWGAAHAYELAILITAQFCACHWQCV